MHFIDLQGQYQELKPAIDQRIQDVLDHGKFIMGPEVQEFELALASYVGTNQVISCANGTDALQLSLMALDIGPGDIVITTPFTFCATAEAIAVVGAEPVFSDIDIQTFNLCPAKLEETISMLPSAKRERLKAVIAVDLFGLPADYPAIQNVCERYNLALVEDGAQGMGGRLDGQMSCSFGDLATTSFFPAKPLGCYGDGGAVLTANDALAEKLRSLRIHGKGKDKYDNVRIGLNSRLDTLQAAILLEKLTVFEQEIAQREACAQRYEQTLSQWVDVPLVPKGYRSSWAQYTIRTERRDALQTHLKSLGIPSQIYYVTSLHQQTAYAQYVLDGQQFGASEEASRTVLSLPMTEPEPVIDALQLFFEQQP